MNIKILRARKLPTRTIGQLYINDELFCFTLEDVVREVAGQPVEKWKIKNETAIPVGRYKITMENSPRFGPDTITVNNVVGFSGVRVHSGNNENDTEGCIIVGYKLTPEAMIKFGTTKTALADLKTILKRASGVPNGPPEEIWLTLL